MTETTCAERSCSTEVVARGMCMKHYLVWRREHPGETRLCLPWPENLLARMEPQPNGCIYFTGWINTGGYGVVKREGRDQRAHRAAYELFVGPIPEGLVVDHECHNRDWSCLGGKTCLHRRCVNFEHLHPKTHHENMAAAFERWGGQS